MLSEVALHQESRLQPSPITITLGLAALRCHRLHNDSVHRRPRAGKAGSWASGATVGWAASSLNTRAPS